MDKLEAMQVYVCVVDTHSFIRAAEVLGVPRSTVSRVVKELESWLKIQLLQRTTRKLSVTAEGRLKRRTKNAKAFHDKCENFSFRASNETAVLITAFYSLHGDHLGYG